MHQTISPAQAHDWLRSKEATLIDVRNPEEFGVEHIAYAASVPLDRVDEILQTMELPSGHKIIFQCYKGGRGAQACALLADSKPGNPVFNIEGGIGSWKEAGLPVITSEQAGFSIFRQVQMIVGSLVLFMIILGFAGLTLGFIIAGILGGALAFAGFTGWCGLAMLLQKMPWNKKR